MTLNLAGCHIALRINPKIMEIRQNLGPRESPRLTETSRSASIYDLCLGPLGPWSVDSLYNLPTTLPQGMHRLRWDRGRKAAGRSSHSVRRPLRLAFKTLVGEEVRG